MIEGSAINLNTHCQPEHTCPGLRPIPVRGGCGVEGSERHASMGFLIIRETHTLIGGTQSFQVRYRVTKQTFTSNGIGHGC